ncbi:unnamed protein product [Lactuca saligna]|uniref:Uncharacterized protein n=1 Tax=Lactuca saligna TaxID=75948 RepID=A0AA35Z106_LACSI|nr:unnamed protein product [Lactuca saligna]
MALLYADPFDVEAQKKIEAAIWQNPEAFARVVMLYVDIQFLIKLNMHLYSLSSGLIQAFVDGWALLMELDSPNMEFLFELDMLCKHQCITDLKDNVLRVGGGVVAVNLNHIYMYGSVERSNNHPNTICIGGWSIFREVTLKPKLRSWLS